MYKRVSVAVFLAVLLSGCIVSEQNAALREQNAELRGRVALQAQLDQKNQKIADLVENMRAVARNDACMEFVDTNGDTYLNIIC